jgi:hypothetical protein
MQYVTLIPTLKTENSSEGDFVLGSNFMKGILSTSKFKNMKGITSTHEGDYVRIYKNT